MKAARVVERGRMACEETDVVRPGDGDVLVRNHMAAICGSDLHVVYDGINLPEAPAPFGFPGHEGVGEVVESREAGLRPGDLVLTCPTGAYTRCFAEYQTLPARYTVPLPAYDGPVEHLLMAQQFGTTIFALRRHPRDLVGRTVMVMGQGSAGVFFAWLARRQGARTVIVSDLSEARLSAARATGADVAVQADPSGANVRAAVDEHTGGRGADLVIEAVGRSDTFLQAVDLARVGGEILFFGMPETSAPIAFNFHDCFRKKLRIYTTYGTQEEADQASFRWALDLIASGQIDVSGLVSHRLPLESIGEALRLANERSDNARKVTLTFA